VVNSLAEVKAHYAEVRDLLPPTPFIMDGQWVVRLDADGPKTFADRADAQEFFSPNGEYVLVVRPVKDPDERDARQQELLSSRDGQVYWDRPAPVGRPYVLNSGRVLVLRGLGPDETAIAVVADRDTGGLVRQAELDLAMVSVFECGRDGLLVAEGNGALEAFDQLGNTAWQLSRRKVTDQFGWLLPPIGSDPLGHGLCAGARAPNGDFGIVLLDPTNGKPQRWLSADVPTRSLCGLSPLGSMLAVVTSGGVGLIDWRAGATLFKQTASDPSRPAALVAFRDAVSASDSPARLAAPTWADCVFDRTGRLIWYNHVAAGMSRRLVLSSDGRRLGTVLWEWAERGRGPTVHSVVVYDLPADGQAMRGL